MKKKILQGIIILNILMFLVVGCSRNINKDEEKTSDEKKQEELVQVNTDELQNEQQDKEQNKVESKEVKEASISEDNNETKIENQISEDGEIFNLYIEDDSLYISYGDKSLFFNKVGIPLNEVQYKVLYNDENEMYVVVYYSYLHCGGAGRYIPFHVVKIDKIQRDLQYLFDEDKILYDYKFVDDKLQLTIDGAEKIIIDTSNIIANLGEEKKRDLLSSNTISVGSTSMLEVNDYVGDNTQQLFIRYQVEDINSSIELGYIYMVLQIKQEEVRILKVFEEDLNNEIVNSIGENSYWEIADEEVNKDLINRLIENNVVRRQDGFLVFSFK